MNIEEADEGGYIVRCSFEGKDKDGDHKYESKTKIFTTAAKVSAFVSKAIEEMDSDMEEEEY